MPVIVCISSDRSFFTPFLVFQESYIEFLKGNSLKGSFICVVVLFCYVLFCFVIRLAQKFNKTRIVEKTFILKFLLMLYFSLLLPKRDQLYRTRWGGLTGRTLGSWGWRWGPIPLHNYTLSVTFLCDQTKQ